MSWVPDDLDEAREQARKALSLPIGLSSPLWMAFGAATGAGVAWWWATRWTRAVNLEAMAKAQVDAVEAFVEREAEAANEVVVVAEKVLAAAQIIEPKDPEASEAAKVIEPKDPEASETAPDRGGDDLTRLAGVGPKLAAALYDRGISTFAQIADWTEENVADLDAELGLKGRVARDEWVAQARRFADEAEAR